LKRRAAAAAAQSIDFLLSEICFLNPEPIRRKWCLAHKIKSLGGELLQGSDLPESAATVGSTSFLRKGELMNHQYDLYRLNWSLFKVQIWCLLLLHKRY
jgi:hypothetical protein